MKKKAIKHSNKISDAKNKKLTMVNDVLDDKLMEAVNLTEKVQEINNDTIKNKVKSVREQLKGLFHS